MWDDAPRGVRPARSVASRSRRATSATSSRPSTRRSFVRRGGDRVRPAPRRRRPAGGGARVSTARSRHASTRRGCSRDRGAHAGVRPLRLLPADVPDVRPLERGDGLAARADPADGEDGAGHARAEPDRDRALRPLPRVHGLRHELPVGRALRPADRGDAGDGRGRAAAPAGRAAPAAAAVRDAAPPPADALGAAAGAARTAAADARVGPADARPRAALALVRAAGAGHALRIDTSSAGASGCSRAACSRSCSAT